MVTIKTKLRKQGQGERCHVFCLHNIWADNHDFPSNKIFVNCWFFIRFYTLSIENWGFDLTVELGTEIFVIYCLSDVYSSFKFLTNRRGERWVGEQPGEKTRKKVREADSQGNALFLLVQQLSKQHSLINNLIVARYRLTCCKVGNQFFYSY